ncbi:SDR family NAD(P)-dependent oxidoreductase [Indiicoccus explosivorum]|uniref:SDR family NAD(P)-dependent oxidoreductase n=1 Tax=Indiicoccus explosivorum TaxID=1917864 RepID=UPI000B4398AC|nr:SDR family NAD(P)-dependent oxidoreductase [Indiicoccus explosivorum]
MYNYTFMEYILFFGRFKNSKLADNMKGKTLLISGASSGIGKSLVYQLADAEVHLIVVARRGELLKAIADDLSDKPATISIAEKDLRKPEEVKELIELIHQLPGGLDAVISNAGHSIRRPLSQSLDRFHDFERTMSINYMAPVQLLLSVIPLLEKSEGMIVNVSTINALLPPVPYWAAYQASKTAFDVWLRSAKPELEGMGIRTASVYLPLVRTPMISPTARYARMPAMHPDHVAKIICEIVVKRKQLYKPWWLFPFQLGSVLFAGFLERVHIQRIRKKEGDR